MAKRGIVETVVTTKRTTGTPPSGPTSEPTALPGDDGDFDSEVEGAIAELGTAGSRCRITRLDESRQQFVMLCTVDAAQVSQEFVQTQFGGGTYKLRFRNAGGQWGKQVTVIIDRRIEPKIPKWLLGEAEQPATTAAGKGRAGAEDPDDEDDEKMFKRMYRMRFLDLIEQGDKLRARQDEQALRSSEMTMKMMTTTMESITAAVGSLRAQPNAQPAMSITDILKMQADARREAMELLKDLRGGNAEAQTIDKTLATMHKLREQASTFFGDDAEAATGSGIGGLLLELGKALAPALAKMFGVVPADAPAPTAPAAPGRPAIAPPAPPAPAAAPAAATTPSQPETPAVEGTPLWLTFAKASLLDAAQEGRDPQSYAISVLELVPRPMHGQIREAVMREDAQQLILERVPELETYQVWLAQCIEGFRLEFNPPIEEVQS